MLTVRTIGMNLKYVKISSAGARNSQAVRASRRRAAAPGRRHHHRARGAGVTGAAAPVTPAVGVHVGEQVPARVVALGVQVHRLVHRQADDGAVRVAGHADLLALRRHRELGELLLPGDVLRARHEVHVLPLGERDRLATRSGRQLDDLVLVLADALVEAAEQVRAGVVDAGLAGLERGVRGVGVPGDRTGLYRLVGAGQALEPAHGLYRAVRVDGRLELAAVGRDEVAPVRPEEAGEVPRHVPARGGARHVEAVRVGLAVAVRVLGGEVLGELPQVV